MWTIDAQCSRCSKKTDCPDRPEIIKALTGLAAKLNTAEPFVSGPGDGLIVVACRDISAE